MNPSTALAVTLADELIRCGMTDAVVAPGSRSAPLAMELFVRAQRGDVRLHVRIDERSAGYLALGLAKASRRPVCVVCTSGTAAASFHPAVIEADESCVPLLVLTADRPPELRGTGANQAIDQIKLYGAAVRWFCEVGAPEAQPGMVGYWRSLACRAWGLAAGTAGGPGGPPGPVHLNLAFRDPLVPEREPHGGEEADNPGAGQAGQPAWEARADGADPAPAGGGNEAGPAGGASEALNGRGAGSAGRASRRAGTGWPEVLAGRSGGAPWTTFGGTWTAPPLELPWTECGLVICGDGDGDTDAVRELAESAGWPILAEPSSGARRGPNALSAYDYVLGCSPLFMSQHRPDVIISAGRPGLSRLQTMLYRSAAASGLPPDGGGPGAPRTRPPARHIVLSRQPGRWDDPSRTASDVVPAVRLTGAPGGASAWLEAWLRADAAARRAADQILDAEPGLTEPRLARDLTAALPPGALLWAASSLPIRDLDHHMAPRAGLRVLASRGASGIDGTTSAAIGAALAHQAAGGGPAFALLGDLAFLHDAPGLFLGPGEPRPDLCLVVVNNDGGGIFSQLEQAAFPGPFERVFGTPHGASVAQLAGAAGLPYTQLENWDDLPGALAGHGLRIVEARTTREAGTALRARLQQACRAAAARPPRVRSSLSARLFRSMCGIPAPIMMAGVSPRVPGASAGT
jgi:2-succinyl-5-enolpyruvyl-6-hydroxy-3-cyclohexene-1-carboxylate synthase